MGEELLSTKTRVYLLLLSHSLLIDTTLWPQALPLLASKSRRFFFIWWFKCFFPPKHRKCQKVLGKNMELWENEVYRFKTIGQLKVGKRGVVSPLLYFIWSHLLLMVPHYSLVSGHQSVFAQRRSSSETGHLRNDLARFSQNRLWGTLSLVVDENKTIVFLLDIH